MDEYQYPLFFEARDLTDRERGRVMRHFQKRKDSGGGDCSTIEKAGAKTYKVCFKDKEDQERVLQRKFHTIPLPDGDLRLTVSRTDSPQTFDQLSTSQSQIFTKPNTKTLEKIFKPDIFLLFYLRDNLKANKLLQKQLSAIGCTVELDLDEEWAVVRGDVDKGPGGAFVSAADNWGLQVDRVFISLTESYLCYHVVEPKQANILMQDLTFVTDDIKVYTESGYPVVVGDIDTVKDRIAILEKSLPTQKELPIAERQFKVVEEEFNRVFCTHCPEVKIHRGNATIILEGPDKEVKSGATKLDELIRKVKDKRVKLPTELLTFMTSSGAISKYQARFQQSRRNPVCIEVGSELVLSSVSSDALDEAEAKIKRDLSLDNVQLQGAAAVPPHLDRVKEILMKAKTEANLRELRVDVSFIPEPSGAAVTKVRLVGYSESVNKLKEVLNNYQMNQVETQELLSLPHPELVDCFHDVLKMIGMKQNKVTLEASHFPYPSVLVSGPRCLVKEVQTQLNATLASLTKETLVLDGPAAWQYFQEEGKMHKELVESSCQVIIREQQGMSGTTSSAGTTTVMPRLSMTRPSCNYAGSTAVNKTSLEIKLGNLVDEQVNVLVAPMINGQLASTKIGSCLIEKAGNAINSTFDWVAANRTFAPGDVLQVDAPPSLGCSKLFFIECLPWDGVRGQSMQALDNGLKTCLDLCVQQRVSSVAIPIIGPGILLKYPLRVAIELLTENIRLFGLSASTGSLSSIHIVIKPGYPDSEECYHDVYRQLSSTIDQGGQAIFKSLSSDLDDISMTVGGEGKLQLMFGDFTNEITDVVVNTTNFVHFQNVPQRPHVQQLKRLQQWPSLSPSTDLSILPYNSTNQKSIFLFLGLSRQDVDNAMTMLQFAYQVQCSTQTLRMEDLVGLTQDDVEDLRQLVESHGLNIQRDQSGPGRLMVRGLKDPVNQVTKKINDSLQESLRREVRAREEEELFKRVAWCILGNNGNWERLPKTANYKLEKNDRAGRVVDAQGAEWSVDAQRFEAIRRVSGQMTKLKRLVNLPDFTLPLYWDNMAAGEAFKAVALQPSSAEYKSVMEAFKRTVTKTVMKIERLQNVHLRRAYEARKKQISDDRRQEGGEREKLLYHGTTRENCDSIMKTGFNRRFAGQNATSYGRGTYFAVNANYSAHSTYSKPAADGSQLMFVARVLTGVYTLGSSDMRVPPPRSSSQPHDRCDSVVDRIDNPSMYVVFHDTQAYPDYLITFR